MIKRNDVLYPQLQKLWFNRVKVIGAVSEQEEYSRIYAYPMIAYEFASWLVPEFKLLLLKLSLDWRKTIIPILMSNNIYLLQIILGRAICQLKFRAYKVMNINIL